MDLKEGSYTQFFDDAGAIIGIFYFLQESDLEGEKWCISKHLLASWMRGQEVGNKFLEKNEQKEKLGFFDNIKKGFKSITGK